MSQPAVASLLRAFARAMGRLELSWYVFGAQAVVAYGRPRMTADVDITVDLGERSTDELISSLRKDGFSLRVAATPALLIQARVLPVVHEKTEMPLDIVLAGPGLESEFMDRAARLDLGGVVAPVISAEDLIVTKILAGRAKDLDDVRGVLEHQRKAIHLARIRTLLRALESALDRSDLLPSFEELLRAAPGSPRRRSRRR